MNLQPLGDRIIVEVLEEEQTTVSGIVLPTRPRRSRSADASSRPVRAVATTQASAYRSTSPTRHDHLF